jgi:methylamine dehydrogenase accessory protein MauD
MTDALLISNVLVWIALIALALAVLALARQIGVLHERIRPVGALSLGKTIGAGETAPAFQLPSLTGGTVRIGGVTQDGRSTLLFFVSASCPVCKTLLPVLKNLVATESQCVRLVFASDGTETEHQPFIRQHQLDAFPYVLSTDVGMAYRISKLPYAVLISATGVVITHGLVNTREHLDSLLEAQALGVSSQQAYGQASGQAAA